MKNKFLTIFLIIFICFSFFSCDPPEVLGNYVLCIPLSLSVFSESELNTPLEKVCVSIHNESVSDSILAYNVTDEYNKAQLLFIYITKGSYTPEINEYACKNLETLETVKDQIESSGETKFYIVVNDDKVPEYYKPEYETKRLYLNKFNNKSFETTVYLSSASNVN